MCLKNVVDGFSCILDFPKFSERTPGPSCKGTTSIKSSNSFFNNSSQRRKRAGKALPQQSTRHLSLGYTEIEKKQEGKIFFVWFVIWLFETLIFALVEDKDCDSCIISSWTLLIFLLCLWWWIDQIQIPCAVWLRKLENLAMTFCNLWLTEKLWLLRDTASPPSPL